MVSMENYYILMADVINSKGHEAEAMEVFFRVVEKANAYLGERLVSPLTVTLGDEFQGVLHGLADAVAAIVFIEEGLLLERSSVLLRYVVHLGGIENDVNPVRAHAMVGSGLTYARAFLDELKKKRERFGFRLGDEKWDGLLEEMFLVWGSFLEGWKGRDYAKEWGSKFLEHGGYKELADAMNEDRRNIWRKEKTLQVREYMAQRRAISGVVQLWNGLAQ